jgi:proton-translocating NADH-quinone oxidoreductase chain M|tara:strand:- start:730 stop:2193 length:1464 start_codon:yes stop_codon:yes gene_type:complete
MLLSNLILIPLIGSFLVLFIPSQYKETIKVIVLSFSLAEFLLSLMMWMSFDNSSSRFQFVEVYNWIESSNIIFYLGVDGISLFFILLTTLLIPICLLASWDAIKFNEKEYFIAFLAMEALVIAVFCVLDIILFYVFFESVLIPMFIIIGVWGSRERRIRAAYMFFLYTLLGSVLMLLAILYIYYQAGTTDYQILLTTTFDPEVQKLLWLAFFASFAVKVPMLPVHIWLPEAHVEAPTAGSVILAGILLKLGSYGFLRFSLPLFPYASVYFTPFIYSFACIAVIYTSLTAIRQTDLKRIIAYASVAHMNLVLIGMFVYNLQGLEGSILQQLSHGLVSGALFLCVGVIYDRHHTRLVKYYSGLAHTMPIYIAIFMFFSMANIALPGTSSFVGEFLILAGAFQANTTVCVLSATGMILGGGYSLWLFNRVAFGNIKVQYMKAFSDVDKREFATLLPLIVLTLVMGIYPEIFLDPMHVSCNNLLSQLEYGY